MIFFDRDKYSYARTFTESKKTKHLYIGKSLNILEKMNFPISQSLKSINDKVIFNMKKLNIKEGRFTYYKISDRLSLARNKMMHGEQLTFFDKGKYMLMLYILFRLNEMKEKLKA